MTPTNDETIPEDDWAVRSTAARAAITAEAYARALAKELHALGPALARHVGVPVEVMHDRMLSMTPEEHGYVLGRAKLLLLEHLHADGAEPTAPAD